MLDTLEDRLDSVVFLMRDGIEFVGMTSGTVDGEAQKRLAYDADHVFKFILASDRPLGCILLTIAGLIIGPTHQQTGRDNSIAGDRLKHITGDLFSHESVVRFVFVKTLDHVITVVPCVFA